MECCAQFLACLLLFMFGNLLACLLANLLQGRFNKATQAKLTDALRKVRPAAWLIIRPN